MLLRPFTPGVEIKFPLVIVRRSLTDMYTAHACVVKEKQLQEARNCGTGQSLDCCLKVLRVRQILRLVLIQVVDQMTSLQLWILTLTEVFPKSSQEQILW